MRADDAKKNRGANNERCYPFVETCSWARTITLTKILEIASKSHSDKFPPIKVLSRIPCLWSSILSFTQLSSSLCTRSELYVAVSPIFLPLYAFLPIYVFLLLTDLHMSHFRVSPLIASPKPQKCEHDHSGRETYERDKGVFTGELKGVARRRVGFRIVIGVGCHVVLGSKARIQLMVIA